MASLSARLAAPIALLAASAAVLGCPPDESGDDDSAGESDDDATPSFEPTLTNIRAQVFEPSCDGSSCHSESGHRGDLVLVGDTVYEELLVDEVQEYDAAEDGWVRVAPGDPDASFLVLKLTWDLLPEDYGYRMPRNTDEPLDPGKLAAIREWIRLGAADD